MREENEITEEVKELLDSLERHGQNARRQKELSDLIDRLAGEEKPIETNHKRHKLYPLWWIVGAAAACLLLWLLVKPSMKETPNMNEEILVEETGVLDTIITHEENGITEESVIPEEPIITEKLLAEETPVKLASPKHQSTTPTPKNTETTVLTENDPTTNINTENLLAEITQPIDTSNIGSNPITITEENLSPLTSHLSPPSCSQRRVIQSLNLVCYECPKEPENTFHLSPLNSQLEKTIFGQPQDPNMKNGSLAFEVKPY